MDDKLDITIRQMTDQDFPAVVKLQEKVFPNMPIWRSEDLSQHLKVFPEGQFVAVDPDVHRKGIGTLLYQSRKKMVKDRGLKRILTGGRIPGYAAVSNQISPRQYVTEVIQGKRKDQTLNFQLKNGFVILITSPNSISALQSLLIIPRYNDSPILGC